MAIPALHHHAEGQAGVVNVLSLAAGAALAAYGLRRGGLAGAAFAVAGGGLFYAGLPRGSHFRHSIAAVIPASEGIRVDETVVVDRPAALVYRFWRQLENLPTFMTHLVSVRATGPGTSHWVARGPARTRIDWDARVINDVPNKLIAWKSMPHADVENAGSVHFTAANNGAATIVRVELKYNPPAGKLGAAVARLLGEEPTLQVRDDLYHFKKLIEEPDFSPAEIDVLRRHSVEPDRKTGAEVRRENERVDEASEESFPASDSPGWKH